MSCLPTAQALDKTVQPPPGLVGLIVAVLAFSPKILHDSMRTKGVKLADQHWLDRHNVSGPLANLPAYCGGVEQSSPLPQNLLDDAEAVPTRLLPAHRVRLPCSTHSYIKEARLPRRLGSRCTFTFLCCQLLLGRCINCPLPLTRPSHHLALPT